MSYPFFRITPNTTWFFKRKYYQLDRRYGMCWLAIGDFDTYKEAKIAMQEYINNSKSTNSDYFSRAGHLLRPVEEE